MRLRSRLYLVVAASMLPVAAMLFYSHVALREARESAAHEAASDQATGIASSLSQIVIGMKHLLMTVSRAPLIKSGEPRRCRDYLATVRKAFPDTLALGVANLAGTVYCTSLPVAGQLNIADRGYFRKALDENRFVVGEAVSGRVTGQRSLTFGYPVRDDVGRHIAVMFASMGLRELAERFAPLVTEPSFTLVVTDPQGVIVLDLPSGGRLGERLGDEWRRLLAHGTPITAEITEHGSPRIAAAVPLTGDASGLFVIAARDRAWAFAGAERASRRDAVLMGLALLWALALIWMITRWSVERPVRGLVQAAGAWRDGDYAVRAPLGGGSEISSLSRVFNAMAQSLQERDEERKAARRNLSDAKDAAVRANRAKSSFLAAVSHDLRQPLTALTLGLDSAENWSVPAHMMKTLARMKRSTTVIEELLDSLNDLSKLESGQVKASIEPLCAATLLKALTDEFAPIASNRGLAMRVEPCDAWVRSDVRLLGRILRNLVMNALKYTPSGGHIRIACAVHDAYVDILVQDDGVGIAPERQQDVFEEFQQVESPASGSDPGLGLGLAIVKRLAAVLQHDIGLASEPGKGSTFTVSVPLAHERPGPAEGPAAER